MQTQILKRKIPKSLKIELPYEKMKKLTEIAEKKGLWPTAIARMWVLEKLEEYESREAGA
mgnify:CR=1 FL=1